MMSRIVTSGAVSRIRRIATSWPLILGATSAAVFAIGCLLLVVWNEERRVGHPAFAEDLLALSGACAPCGRPPRTSRDGVEPMLLHSNPSGKTVARSPN